MGKTAGNPGGASGTMSAPFPHAPRRPSRDESIARTPGTFLHGIRKDVYNIRISEVAPSTPPKEPVIFTKPPRRLSGYQAYAEKGENIPLLEIGEIKARSDWQVPPHAHAGVEIHIQWKGVSRWKVEGRVHRIPENGFYLIHPALRHSLLHTDGGDVHFAYLVFPESVIPRGLRGRPPFDGGFFSHDLAHRLATPFQEIQREVSRMGHHRGRIIQGYLEILCWALASLGENPPVEKGWAAHPASLLARELMDGKPEGDWNLARLATLCGVSVPHLIEIFHRDFGRTPRQYLLALRLDRARSRLLAGDSVTSVAMDLGFSSGQHLSAAYRKTYRESPRKTLEKIGTRRRPPNPPSSKPGV